MARREKRTAAQAWLERWNPLQGMSIREAQNIFDAARGGDTQRLHWIFQEIEATNPVLLVCVERRSSAIANFQWRVSENAASDGALSGEQKDAVERLLNGVENFTDALEHLDLAFFRGFAHAQPIWESDGSVREVQLLESWKFVRQGSAWFYNPACTGLAPDMQPTDRCGLMTVVRRRPIDYPALSIHIRHAIGSRDWGRFLERYALPKPAVFMHPGATNDQKADYLAAANAVENGQVSVWPNGSSLTDFAGGSRGTDPFGTFIDHQEKQIVLLATGGTLMSLAESGSGTLAGGAQSEVWESIVSRDSSVISQAVQRAMVVPYLERAFPGRPCTVSFGFDFTKPPTPKEVFEVAEIAKQAGWRIDQAQLEEQTGYTLIEDTPPSASGPSAPSGAIPFLNKAADSSRTTQDASGASAGGPRSDEAHGGSEAAAPDAVLKAFAEDTGAAAAAVRKLLENPTPDAAAALLRDLPALIPDDPALAAVIAEEMAKEFCKPVANKQDANGMEHGEAGSGNGGQFVPKNGGSSGTSSNGKVDVKSEKPATDEEVKSFLEGPVKDIDVEVADALLTRGFEVQDASGNKVHFGPRMKKHLEDHEQGECDRRKRRLRHGVELVRNTEPVISVRDANVSCYFGKVNGKGYLVMADNSGEVYEVWDEFRRDSWKNEKKKGASGGQPAGAT